ncbi:hypothetical protein GDO86_003187 [Hymenochirus boettgeri]|uniref:Uncharacterized protein n=1 Tax=Hymenochirus boettgeri TaxID=247094 RepID=A0A8T2K2I2_9PIPI|nr:hypothetical protein GDO86_003187 [Hymenochirus boettgeri]
MKNIKGKTNVLVLGQVLDCLVSKVKLRPAFQTAHGEIPYSKIGLEKNTSIDLFTASEEFLPYAISVNCATSVHNLPANQAYKKGTYA